MKENRIRYDIISGRNKCIDYFCHLAVKPEFYSQIAGGRRNESLKSEIP